MQITENTDNLRCDTYGCSNDAKFRVGKEGESPRQQVLYCEECLQGVINAAPIGMIMNRPEFEDIEEDEFIPEDSLNGKYSEEELKNCTSNSTNENLENVGKALEGEYENPMCFDEMNFKDLKKIAVEKGLEFKVGMSKLDLIKYLEGTK